MTFLYGYIAGVLTILLPSLVALAVWFKDAPYESEESRSSNRRDFRRIDNSELPH